MTVVVSCSCELEGKTKPVWIDLFDPTKDEELAAEKLLGISIPTREEMHEIEISSRLYTEDGTLYMTATLPEKADSQHPIMMPVTFILAKERLVTVRYHEPGAFSTYPQRAKQTDMACDNAESVLVGILEAVVDRLADVLEKASLDIVAIGQDIFHPDAERRGTASRLPDHPAQDRPQGVAHIQYSGEPAYAAAGCDLLRPSDAQP